MKRLTFIRIAAALLLGAASLTVGAVQRTFVASYGLDTNPCSVASPCRSFGAAIAATDANGEVIVLDSAGYGAFTVTQSVSVIAPAGVYAGISVFSDPGITIAAGASGRVTLRGLTINGIGLGLGIRVQSAAEVHIDNCVVNHTQQYAILADAAGGHIFINGTVVRGSLQTGMAFVGTVEAWLDGVVSEFNDGGGITAENGAKVWVSNSIVSNNHSIGIIARNLGGPLTQVVVESSNIFGTIACGIGVDGSTPAELSIVRSTISGNGCGMQAGSPFGATTLTLTATDNLITGNGSEGIFAQGLGTTVIASGNTVTRNGSFGFRQFSDGLFLSRGNNTVSGNNSGGAQASGTITPLGGL